MGRAKDIIVKPISSKDGNRIIKALHYSGKVVQNSQIHLGVFLDGKCGGALSFGPSMDKRKVSAIVAGTKWNEFLELNRMALADWLPRNGESRAIAVAMRILKKNYPQLRWIISYSDGTQCGDGTIYRASGFILTGITKNSTIYEFPDGERVADIGIKTGYAWQKKRFGKTYLGEEAMRQARKLGAKKIPGFQLRYIYFLDSNGRKNLTVKEIPFSEISRRGAGMYRGEKRVQSADSGTSGIQPGGDGANPI